jgi:uncharacterized phage infection (PIP) family protein YhgE
MRTKSEFHGYAMNALTFLIFVVCFASLALADDFKTTDGREYKNVTVSKQEPDGITVKNMKAGIIAKLHFTELPKEVQERYHYDAEKAAAYSAGQNATLEQLRKQQEEAMRQKAEATQKNNEQLAKEQTGIQWTNDQRQNVQALQSRYQQLQQQEGGLLHKIGELENLPEYLGERSRTAYRGWYHYKNPGRADLPSLHSQLDDVRHEKDQVRKQLEEAQR